MSHNDPTHSHATERRTGVTLVAAVSPAIDAGNENWLHAEYFAARQREFTVVNSAEFTAAVAQEQDYRSRFTGRV